MRVDGELIDGVDESGRTRKLGGIGLMAAYRLDDEEMR